MPTNWTIRNVPQQEKKSILLGLDRSIKRYGIQKTKTVITNYFKNYGEKTKAQKRIEELKEEISRLEKKK